MLMKPQYAASQDKNYLLLLTPIIAVMVFTFQTKVQAMAMGPYIDLSEIRTPTNKPHSNTWSHTSTTNSAEDKNIDAGDDQVNQDHVREAIPLWETKSLNHRSWSEHVYDELPTLGPALLAANPTDAKIFCPNYTNLSDNERKQFWAFFISSMAKFESGFDPKSAYTEGFRDNSGRYVISRGLLQISMESSKGYRCGFTTSTEIHSPTKNLSCGIKILNHWMKKDQRIASRSGLSWKGGARYWSVLRAGEKSSYQSIIKWSNNLPFCKL